jgi:hypothetical protein
MCGVLARSGNSMRGRLARRRVGVRGGGSRRLTCRRRSGSVGGSRRRIVSRRSSGSSDINSSGIKGISSSLAHRCISCERISRIELL